MMGNISEEKLLVSAQYEKEEAYWLENLGGEAPQSGFPFMKGAGRKEERRVETKGFFFTEEVGSRLLWMSNQSLPRLHMILVAGMFALLSRYQYWGGEKLDIVIGTLVAKTGVDIGEGKRLLNTLLPLRVRAKAGNNLSFKELLMEVRQVVTEAVKNQGYPLEVLPVRPGVSFSAEEFAAFFDVMVLLEPYHDRRYLEFSPVTPGLVLISRVEGERVRCEIDYNAGVIPAQGIEVMTTHLQNLFQEVLYKPEARLVDVEILTEAEKRELVVNFNDTAADYPWQQTIHGLFAGQVEKYGDGIAVVGGTVGEKRSDKPGERVSISYSELNKRAERVAYGLREQGALGGNVVALLMEPSVEMIASILGVLKAGCGYLPLDPKHPLGRITAMMDDCCPPVVLTEERVLKQHSYTALQGLRTSRVSPLVTSVCPQVEAMDDLPFPDRSLVDYDKYNRYIGQAMVKHCMALQGSRGCPYNCAYCHKIWPKKQAIRSAANLFEEVKLYYDMGVRRFAIIDDIFNLDVKNSSAFFRMLIDHGMKVQLFFPNGLRGDILTRDYIDLMVEAGTVNVALALETASPRLQKLIKKNLNLEKFEANMGYFMEKYPQVILELFTMHGFPTETEEEAMMTLDFIGRQKWLHFPYVHILKIYPNTDMAVLARENGVTAEAIAASVNLAYHELPETLPFDKRFTLNYQASFLNGYFLSKERLLHVLPQQMKSLTHDELVEKYDSYLPTEIKNFGQLLEFTGIREEELGGVPFLEEATVAVRDLNQQIKVHFPVHQVLPGALRVLLLDLSQHFSHEEGMLYDVVEPPLGLMYLLTYLKRELGERITGKVAKARIDFDNYSELKELVEEFKPDVIGMRALSFYKDGFHRTAALLREWCPGVPIIGGGPYATSDYTSMLQDGHIDLAVLGEGELITARLLEAILAEGKKLPLDDRLSEIPGLAFIPGGRGRLNTSPCRQVMVVDRELSKSESDIKSKIRIIPVPLSGQEVAFHDLAYVIFTSGSTGKPKGVMIEHGNVVRLLTNSRNPFDFSPGDTWTLFHSYCFDFSVWEMYGALLYGGKVMVFSRTLSRDTGGFLDFLEREGVTVLNQTPSAFYHLCEIEEMRGRGGRLKLRYVIFGGEALNPGRLRAFQERYPGTRLINMFGITETTVHVTFKQIEKSEIEQGLSNIGKPIPTLQTYILDSQSRLLPVGIAGELYVGGAGVARGYVNQPDLTHDRFIPSDRIKGFNSLGVSGTLYRSGDLTRWLPGGDMEYLGRIDQQVQVRGFRVELGEIENRLLSHPWVQSAAVVAGSAEAGMGDQDIFLCAYVVPVAGSGWQLGETDGLESLKEYLGRWLPEYMIPSYFIGMEKFPLTANGKLDRKALPDPRVQSQAGTGAFEAPRDIVEKKLVLVWQEVLDLHDRAIGIHDNFFDLGGHSLKATILAAKIHKVFAVKIPLAELFQNPTVAGLAGHIRNSIKDEYVSIPLVEDKEYYPLSSAQKRLYFVQQSEPNSIGYHITFVFTLEGQVDGGWLEEAFRVLVQRHESFRTSFRLVNNRPVQVIHDRMDFFIERFGGGDNLELVVKNFIRSFDLSCAPLIRVGLIEVTDLEHVLMVDVHHIVNDGFSMGTLIRDFTTLYNQGKLTGLSLRYRDYSEWMDHGAGREIMVKQEGYWLKEFAVEVPVLSLPYDFVRLERKTFTGGEVTFSLTEKETAALKQLAKDGDVTLFMVLLAVVNVLIGKLSGNDDIVIGTAATGRRHADLEPVVGMFVNTLALRNYPLGNQGFREFLEVVGERTLQAFDNQDFQFEDLVERLNIPRCIGRNPLFDVMFELQNMEIPEMYLPGLTLKPYPFKMDIAKFDLTLTALERDHILYFSFSYNNGLFKQETVERFTSYFHKIVTQIIDDPDRKIAHIELVSGQKKRQVEAAFNEDLEDE